MTRKFFVGGNFKMNGAIDSVKAIINNLNASKLDANTEVVVAPPSLYLLLVRELANSNIGVSSQNVYDKPNGAYTGELSVSQLKDAKVEWTLTGHSERRTILKESDEVCLFGSLHSCVFALSNLLLLTFAFCSFLNSSLLARPRLPLMVV